MVRAKKEKLKVILGNARTKVGSAPSARLQRPKIESIRIRCTGVANLLPNKERNRVKASKPLGIGFLESWPTG
jgi:hypothetical protein